MEFGDNKMLYLRDTWRESNRICDVMPLNPSSNGVWPSQKLPDPIVNVDFWLSPFPHLQMIFIVISFIWQFLLALLPSTSRHDSFHTGVLLSKTFLRENTAARRFFSTEDYKEIVFSLISALSYMMFWFLMGVKMDMGLIRTTGKKAITIGISSVLLSTMVCSVIFFGNLKDVGKNNSAATLNSLESIVVYSIQCLSSFPVVGNLLFELRLQNSELGRLAISSAVISDFSTSVLASVLIFMKELKDEQTRLGSVFVGDVIAGDRPFQRAGIVVLFVCAAIYVFRPLMFYIIKQTPSGHPVKPVYLSAIIVLVSGSAMLANWCKQSIFMGPFILGLAVPHGPPLGSAIIEKFESAIFGTFLPFFVASSITELDVWSLLGWKDLNGVIFIMVTSFVVKFILTTLPALYYGMPMEDSFAISLIMSSKGIFELGAYALAFQRGSVRPETFTVACLYIMLNSAIIPPILRYLYDPSRMYAGYEKRNMQHLKPNSELRILSCIYRTDDLSPMINLLEATCPSKESHIAAYVLHLMELVGRAHPVFISHKLQTLRTEGTCYSNNVVLSFEKFGKDFFGSVSVSTYTALSMPDTMHGDICMLALNNTTSLIILPFHQTWSEDGSSIVSDSNMIKNLNKSVLKVSPCSVGIFIYRSRNGRKNISEAVLSSSSYEVCMIFLGGKDDREAVTLAARMARDPRINVTVVRMITEDEKEREISEWDKMLDDDLLRGLKSNKLAEIFYTEKSVKDATETSGVLNSLASKFDLFIVGRGNGRKSVFTDGLEEWSEFNELGVIGDLLISQDIKCQGSVLVIQQQQLMI
ncbi:unnamed protein product [Microthlaspi erraticum]|uniref:Uncharacterized protein n=1 Tax=Microthlaspi erraticum TaxID=1685480 RepID=A0A6D2IJE6_9BRAS|nr:unnamed protein product [Microthlaspi erraticum]